MNGFLRRGPRYLAVSCFCLCLSNAILIAVDQLGGATGTAVLVSALILIPVGFWLQSHVTFAVQPNLAAFLRYALGLAANVPLSWGLLFLLHDLCGIGMVLAAPTATILLFFWTYFISSWALNRRSRPVVEGNIS